MVEELLSGGAARLYHDARRLTERGEVDAALANFEEAVSACPGRLDWLVEYGRLTIRNQRWAEGKSAFDRAISQRSGVASWHAARARALVGLGRHTDAVEDYRAAIALGPSQGRWWVGLGRALAATGTLADGIAALKRAVELDAANPAWWGALAVLQLRAGASRDSVDGFDRALALREEPKWYALRARGQAELGRAPEAIADLRRALDLDPTQVGWWVNLARLLGRSARTAEAIEAYRTALTLDNGQAGIHASVGRLLAKRGEIAAAIEHLGRAIDLDGDHPDWRADLNELQELAPSRSAATLSAEKNAQWYDTVYQHSEKYRLGYEDSVYWPVWQKILDRLAALGKPSILEVGCGPGQLAAAIRDRVGASAYLGIDFSARAVAMARHNASNFSFAVGDALHAPEVEQFAYDVVICTEVLEHIERDRDAIRRWRPGAKVIATVPNFDSPSHVRHFRDVNEVSARYAGLIDVLSIEQVAIGRQSSPFLIYGRVADRA